MKNDFLKAISILFFLSLQNPVYAWKARAHLFLAEEAIKDALIDDSVTLYKSDGSLLGSYAVNTDITGAIRNYPAQFRAGAIGPDAYPDILTGQQLIHPSNGAGTCYWLNYLWESTSKGTGPQRAFAAGFFAHGAGDLFGHTFINQFAGGPFELGPNAAKHIIVEGFIDKSLPSLVTWNGHAFTENDVSIGDGLDQFIYEKLVYAAPGSHLGNWLFMGKDSSTSIPKYFSKLRNSLASDIAKYYSRLKKYDDEYNASVKDAETCGFFDFSCSKVLLYTSALLTLAEKDGYRLLHGPVITYKELWRDDIDKGLKAWPALSHEVNIALNCSNSMDTKRAGDACTKFITGHLISMAGAPDVVGGAIELISYILDTFMPEFLKNAIEEAKKDLLNFGLKGATGFSIDDLKNMTQNPETQFSLIGQTLNEFKEQELHMSASDITIDYRNVPAMVNSVNMIKLSLLSKKELPRFLKDLTKIQIPFDRENIMIGTWLGSFDESCQWKSACDTLVIAKDSAVFYSFFKHQTGDTAVSQTYANCSIHENESVIADDSLTLICSSSGLLPSRVLVPVFLPRDGELRFRLSATENRAVATFDFKDTSRNVDIKCGKEERVPCRYRAGQYFVDVRKIILLKAKITTAESASSIYYNLTVSYRPSDIQGFEPDDSIQSARPIPFDTVLFSTIGFVNDEYKYDRLDYYTFSIDAPCGAIVNFSGYAGKNAVMVLDSTKRTIKTNDFTGRGTVITPLLSKGRYYVAVKSYNPNIADYGSYSIRVRLVEYPRTNSKADAVIASGNQTMYGNMVVSDSAKWYSVVLSTKTNVSLALETEGTLKTRVQFFNQDGTTLIDTANSDNTNQYRLESDTLLPGVYYLKVTKISGSGSYQFFLIGADPAVAVLNKVRQMQINPISVNYQGDRIFWTFIPEQNVRGTISIIDARGRLVKILKRDLFSKQAVYRGMINEKDFATGVYYLCMQSKIAFKPVKIMITR